MLVSKKGRVEDDAINGKILSSIKKDRHDELGWGGYSQQDETNLNQAYKYITIER